MKIDLRNLERIALDQPNLTEFRRVATSFKQPEPAPHTEALQIKATAGLGKTRTVIEQISTDPRRSITEVRFHTPDNEHSAEVAKIALGFGLRAKIVSGRTKEMASNGYCARYGVAYECAKAGLNVYHSCCQKLVDGREIRCPHFDQCPYLKQWDDPKPAFRILNHAYIFLPIPQRDGVSLPTPSIVVVDESIVQKSVSKFSFGVDRLQGKYAQAVRCYLDNGHDLRTTLANLGVTKECAERLAEETDPEWDAGISPDLSDRDALKKLKEIDQREEMALASFYRAIAREIDFDRPIYGIEVRRDEEVRVNGRLERQNRVHVFERRQCRIDPTASLLILDADADLKLNKKIFGRDIRHVEINAKRRAHVIQCYSSKVSTTKLLGLHSKTKPKFTPELAKIEEIVKSELARSAPVLVVMPKRVEDTLSSFGKLATGGGSDQPRFWRGAEVTHFGAIRGKDRWKKFNTVIVVGRNEPPARAVDNIMRGLFADDEEEMCFVGTDKFQNKNRGYRMSNGVPQGVQTSVHPDPRGQLILEQLRECESLQAIDRIRLVHSEHPKRVIILSSVPLNITVDEVRSLDDLAGTEGRQGPIWRLKTAMADEGILPLGERDLAKAFPNLFPSQSRARDALRAARVHVRDIELTVPNDGGGGGGGHFDDVVTDVKTGPTPIHGPPHDAGAPIPAIADTPIHIAPTNTAKLNGGAFQIEYLFGFHPHYRRAIYRRIGQRGKASKAIVDINRNPNAKAALSKLIGDKLEYFELNKIQCGDEKEENDD